jgi:KUP system potassium uptake protein
MPLDTFIEDVGRHAPHRVPGVAVFMSSDPEVAPAVLLHHLKHNKVLHEKVVLMSVETENVPTVDPADRVVFRDCGRGFYQVIAKYGFMEMANLLPRTGDSPSDRPLALRGLAQASLHPDDAQRPERHGLLRAATQSGGGTGCAGGTLTRRR